MSKRYKGKYTHLILADVQNGSLTKERVEAMQEDFAAHPLADPAYLDSLNEALTQLLGPEEVMKRQRDREGQQPAPDSEVK